MAVVAVVAIPVDRAGSDDVELAMPGLSVLMVLMVAALIAGLQRCCLPGLCRVLVAPDRHYGPVAMAKNYYP